MKKTWKCENDTKKTAHVLKSTLGFYSKKKKKRMLAITSFSVVFLLPPMTTGNNEEMSVVKESFQLTI